jgi:hypothetical protein
VVLTGLDHDVGIDITYCHLDGVVIITNEEAQIVPQGLNGSKVIEASDVGFGRGEEVMGNVVSFKIYTPKKNYAFRITLDV